MVSPRNNQQQLARYEAFTVLAEGCRHLAQNCVTKGAKFMLNNLADSIERGVATDSYGNIAGLMDSDLPPARRPSLTAG